MNPSPVSQWAFQANISDSFSKTRRRGDKNTNMLCFRYIRRKREGKPLRRFTPREIQFPQAVGGETGARGGKKSASENSEKVSGNTICSIRLIL